MSHKVKQSLMSSRIDFFYYAFRNVLLISVPVTIVFALILSLPRSSARVSSSDNLAISVPSSCTLSSSVDEVHSASIINGTYRSDIGTTALSTFCNDKNGYSVYAIGDSLNSEGNNTLIGSNGSNISSGTATSGDTSNWAMKLSLKAGDTSPTPPTIIFPFDNYTTVPANWTKVATIPSGTTDMEKGSSFTTTYATYISPTQAAGTYLGQVEYLLTHPSAATPTSAYIMQEVANWEDDLSSPGDSAQAIDIRDGKQYWVTRLADGHIWMTQNLDFDIKANTTLNSNTTDLNVVYDASTGNYREYLDGYTESNGVIYYTPASSATTIDFQNTGPIIGWQNSNTAPYTANKTDDTSTGHNSLGNYYNWTAAIASNNSSSLAQDTLSDISKNPKNSICPKGWRLPTISSESETAASSTNEFARLNYLYNNNLTNTVYGLITDPVFFIAAGEVDGARYTTSEMRYTSSTTKNQNNNYFLQYKPSDSIPLNLSASWLKGSGRSIRCIAK